MPKAALLLQRPQWLCSIIINEGFGVLPFSALPLFIIEAFDTYPAGISATVIEIAQSLFCITIYSSFAVLPLNIPRTTRPNQKNSKSMGRKNRNSPMDLISKPWFHEREVISGLDQPRPIALVGNMHSLGYLVLYPDDLASRQSFLLLYNPSTFPLELPHSHSLSFPDLVMLYLPVGHTTNLWLHLFVGEENELNLVYFSFPKFGI